MCCRCLGSGKWAKAQLPWWPPSNWGECFLLNGYLHNTYPLIDLLSVFSFTCSYGSLKREERSWSHFAAPIFVLVFSSLFLQIQLFLQTNHSSPQPLPFCHSNPSSSDLFFTFQGKNRENSPGSKYILPVWNYYYLQTGSDEPRHLLLSLRIWFLQTPLTFEQSKSHIWVVHKHKYLYELSRMSQFSL